ncbi:MAG: RNA 2',3'-cyclic phosphodiesterase [Bdellovibrionota bacterium]
MSELRLFIAVDPEPSVAEGIENFVRASSPAAELRWIPRKNYHLTLKFLGATPQNQIPAVLKVLQGIAETECAFSVIFKGLGVFPDKRNPKVLWIAIEDGSGRLSLLAKKIELAMVAIGFAMENRDYVPHLTVAKVARSNFHASKQWSENPLLHQEANFGPSEVRELFLYESRNGPGGVQYEALARFAFRH